MRGSNSRCVGDKLRAPGDRDPRGVGEAPRLPIPRLLIVFEPRVLPLLPAEEVLGLPPLPAEGLSVLSVPRILELRIAGDWDPRPAGDWVPWRASPITRLMIEVRGLWQLLASEAAASESDPPSLLKDKDINSS
eukprot:657989-Rhodomonas_salina.1